MGNMGYCKFENTYNDLEECYEALSNGGIKDLEQDANQYEKPYIRKLINLCQDIADEFGEEAQKQ